MTIVLKIDNSDMEEQLQYLIKEKHEINVDILRNFLNSFQKEEKILFNKKDPQKYSREIEYIDTTYEDLSDVKPYAHIDDSRQYIHDLRRKSNS